jgi:hypothetical protein
MLNRTQLLWRGLAVKIALLGLLLGAGGNVARAEIWNFYPGFCACTSTGGDATSFTVVFQGDIISDLDLVFTQGNAGINPFAQLDTTLHLSNTSTVTATLVDSGQETQVTYTNGAGPAINSSEASDFPSPKGPHFGLQPSSSDADGAPLTVVSETWDTTNSVPVINTSNPTINTMLPVHFEVVFVQVTSNGVTAGNWFEIPYNGSAPPITLSNPTGSSETLSNVGYQLSPTLIPLDNLNFGTDPPPGFPGSTFTPDSQLDGMTVSAGGSLPVYTPEPSMLLPLAAGIGLLVFASRRRRARAVV